MSSAQNLSIRMYRTRLPGITLVVTIDDRTGNVLKRVVNDELTG